MMFTKSNIYQTLNIKSGEGSAIGLLFVYSFFMGAGFAFFYTASTSLFLQAFKRVDLPIAYIVSGLLVFGIGLPFRYMQRKMKFSNFVRTIVTFLVVTSLIVLLILNFAPKYNIYVYYFIFIWGRVFVLIMTVSFWSVAGKIFDLRQSKRVFSLINTGEVLSFLISFFSVPILLKITGVTTYTLLYISLTSLFFAFLLIFYITSVFKDKFVTATSKKVSEQKEQSAEKLISPKYYKIIYILAFMPIISMIFTDYIFFAQSQDIFKGNGAALSSFLAIVFGVNSLFEFIIKTFLSGRLITSYGIKLGLISLPLVMSICIFLASLSGSFEVTVGMFFAFITLAKLLLRSVRTSFYDPTFQILYQPIPSEDRAAFQSKIEAGPKSLGNVFAGVIVFGLTFLPFIHLVHFSYVYLVLSFVWIYYSIQMYKEYRISVKKIISYTTDETIHNSELDVFNNFKLEFKSAKREKIPLLLLLLEKFDAAKIDTLVLELLKETKVNTPDEIHLISNLLQVICERKIVGAAMYLDEKIKLVTDKDLKQELIDSKSLLTEYLTYDIDAIANMVKSNVKDERLLATNLIGQSRRYGAYKLTKMLLLETDIDIKRLALLSAGKIKNSELWASILENLTNPVLSNVAAGTVIAIGEQILNELDIFLEKYSDQHEIRNKILLIIIKIGGDRAIKLLRNKMQVPDKDLRFRILTGLSVLGYKATKSEEIYINEALDEEVSMYVWIAAAMSDIGRSDSTKEIEQSLQNELSISNQRLFVLLSLIYDKTTIQIAEDKLLHGTSDSKGFAIEILDMTLSQNHKKLIINVLEGLSARELVDKYKNTFPQWKLSKTDRCKDIVLKDFARVSSWTKALALEQMANTGKDGVFDFLKAMLTSPDLFLSRVSYYLLYTLDKTVLQQELQDLPQYIQNRLYSFELKLKNPVIKELAVPTVIVRILENHNLFSKLPVSEMIRIAMEGEILVMEEGQEFVFEPDESGMKPMFFVLEGTVLARFNGKSIPIGESLLSELNLNDLGHGAALVCGSKLKTLVFKESLIYDLSFSHPEIVLLLTSQFSKSGSEIFVNERVSTDIYVPQTSDV